MLAVTGSKRSDSVFSFFFSNQFWFRLRLGLGSGLVLLVFPRSRLCFLYEKDKLLLFEIASSFTKGKLRGRLYSNRAK